MSVAHCGRFAATYISSGVSGRGNVAIDDVWSASAAAANGASWASSDLLLTVVWIVCVGVRSVQPEAEPRAKG